MAELKSNKEVIEEADHVQSKTKAALFRIQQQAAETEELGGDTLDEMREQRIQTQRIQMDAEDFHEQLDKTRSLQNRFDRWAGNWRGQQKKLAKAEASEEIRKADRARDRANIGKENDNPGVDKPGAPATKSSSRARGKVVKRPPKERADLLSSDLANPQVAKLDDDTKMGLNNLVKNDNEIDAMLNQTAASLDRLADLSTQIKQETQAQNKEVDKLTSTMGKASEKQAFINARAKRLLTGRWLKRNETS